MEIDLPYRQTDAEVCEMEKLTQEVCNILSDQKSEKDLTRSTFLRSKVLSIMCSIENFKNQYEIISPSIRARIESIDSLINSMQLFIPFHDSNITESKNSITRH